MLMLMLAVLILMLMLTLMPIPMLLLRMMAMPAIEGQGLRLTLARFVGRSLGFGNGDALTYADVLYGPEESSRPWMLGKGCPRLVVLT